MIEHLYKSSTDSEGAPNCGYEDHLLNDSFNSGLSAAAKLYKEELQKTQADLEACMIERDKITDSYEGCNLYREQLEEKLHSLEKIAREGLSASRLYKKEYLKKIDKLMKGDKK